jgi:hypothetical protein
MASIYEAFEAFSDNQRVERLRECQKILERVLQCQQENENRNNAEAERSKKIEEDNSSSRQSSPKGFTNLIPWRRKASEEDDRHQVKNDLDRSVESRTDEGSSNQRVIHLGKNAPSLNCTVSQDDVWACRALSLRCGKELIALKDCWKKGAESIEQDSAISECCKVEKDILSHCMSKNAFALETRLKQRQVAAKEEKTASREPEKN